MKNFVAPHQLQGQCSILKYHHHQFDLGLNTNREFSITCMARHQVYQSFPSYLLPPQLKFLVAVKPAMMVLHWSYIIPAEVKCMSVKVCMVRSLCSPDCLNHCDCLCYCHAVNVFVMNQIWMPFGPTGVPR